MAVWLFPEPKVLSKMVKNRRLLFRALYVWKISQPTMQYTLTQSEMPKLKLKVMAQLQTSNAKELSVNYLTSCFKMEAFDAQISS